MRGRARVSRRAILGEDDRALSFLPPSFILSRSGLRSSPLRALIQEALSATSNSSSRETIGLFRKTVYIARHAGATPPVPAGDNVSTM